VSVLLRQPHGFEGIGFALERLHVSDLAVVHSYDDRDAGDGLHVVSPDTDDASRDDDLFRADGDDSSGSRCCRFHIPRTNENHSCMPS
jgi:hypothetical protein